MLKTLHQQILFVFGKKPHHQNPQNSRTDSWNFCIYLDPHSCFFPTVSACYPRLEQIKCKKRKQCCCAQGQSARPLIMGRTEYPKGFRQRQSPALQLEWGSKGSSRLQRLFLQMFWGKGCRSWGNAKVEVTSYSSYSEINQFSDMLPAFRSTLIYTPHLTSVLTKVSQYWNK